MTTPNKIQSRCMYCNTTSYGTGCPYSPHKKHVHVVDGQKCIYCGTTSLGTGCPYNPFSKLHIRGAEYNMMRKESIHRSVMTGIFLMRLTEDITDMAAYKLGLIDDRGCRIKESITEEEKAALTPLDMHILKMRRLIGENVMELFKSNVLLEMASKQNEEKFDATKYQAEVKIISQIDHAVSILGDIFSEANEKGFSKERIENLVIESILKLHEDPKD